MGVSKDSVGDSSIEISVTYGNDIAKNKSVNPSKNGGRLKDLVTSSPHSAGDQEATAQRGNANVATADNHSGRAESSAAGRHVAGPVPIRSQSGNPPDKSQEVEKKEKPCDPSQVTRATSAECLDKSHVQNQAQTEVPTQDKDSKHEHDNGKKSDTGKSEKDKHDKSVLHSPKSGVKHTDAGKCNREESDPGHPPVKKTDSAKSFKTTSFKNPSYDSKEDGRKWNKGLQDDQSPARTAAAVDIYDGPSRSQGSIRRGVEMIPMDEIDAPVQYRRIDADKASVFSLYMERDFRYFFQHPYLRLGIAYLVTFCNFLIYAEDPVAHSRMECYIPVVGNCFAFVFTRYPDNGWSVLKVVLWLTAMLCGLIVGKLVIHKLLFGKLFRLKMFAEDQGSWITMFFTVILFVFCFSYLYNAFLLIGGEAMVPYHISSMMGIRNSMFMKAAACGTWCGDFFTAWMVTDIMLQEKLYPNWAVRLRKWWNKGYNRIILFWSVVTTASIVVVTVISTDIILWDKLNRDFLPTNELSRSFLASFILVMDLLILMQDWDFPHFINNFDIKLPGVNVAEFKFRLPRFLMKDSYMIHITGKWFNYGIIFIVMLLDLNMWKNQIFFKPVDYGQYTNETGKIFSIRDDYSLENLNETHMNYEWRSSNINPLTNFSFVESDVYMNSRYYGIPLSVNCTAFIPSIAAMICIGVLVYMFGRFRPTELDPYAGRLKKRKKRSRRRKSSVRMYKDVAGPAVVFDGKNYVPARTNQSYPENWKP